MNTDHDHPYDGIEPFLFVSYARDDSQQVVPIVRAMQIAGVRAWWDRAIQPGQRFGAEIERRLDESAAVVVFLSARALESDWILEEAKHAHQNDAEIIPVLLDGSILTLEWKSLIGRIQQIAGDQRSASTIADEITARANKLGCVANRANSGSTQTMNRSTRTNQGASSAPWILTLLATTGLAVFATLYFSQNRLATDAPTPVQARSDSAPATPERARSTPFEQLPRSEPMAPDVPESYLANLGDESRQWTWSSRSALDNNVVTLHWERCKGVENMSGRNTIQTRGTLADVRRKAGNRPLRACRFCYEIEFERNLSSEQDKAPDAKSGDEVRGGVGLPPR